jgi:hypothetical protein
MNPSRVFLLIVAGCSLLSLCPLAAQVAGTPFEVNQQYSAEMIITTKEGQAMTQKVYADNGKMRSEASAPGMKMITIIRPDQKKMYHIMDTQKIVMEIPFDPATHPVPGAVSANDGKFEVVGAETVEGVACTKYKMTTKDGTVAFFWVDTAKKVMVKMVPEDGSVTIVWKNFVSGPQDAALFEPPTGYQVMQMPSGGGMPGAPGQ